MVLNFLNDAHLKTAKLIGIVISTLMNVQRFTILLSIPPACLVMYKIISGLLNEPQFLEQRLMTIPGVVASLLSLALLIFAALKFHTATEAAGFAKWLRDPAGVKTDLEKIVELVSQRDSLTAEVKNQAIGKVTEFFSVEKPTISTLKSKFKMLRSGKEKIEAFSESLSEKHQDLIDGFTATIDAFTSPFVIVFWPVMVCMLIAFQLM